MYQPFLIGNRFRVVPPGTSTKLERLDLIMERGAFGSGEHETTHSCLELLEDLPEVRQADLLDLGSGTGILAIAALKLGAAAATCVDISPEAVDNCRHNCVLNGCADQVTHVAGSLSDLGSRNFDLVLANIYGDLLLQFASDLASRVRPGGLLLLSGILWEYNFAVRQTYAAAGCELLRNRMLEEFSTLLLQKR
ncbi:MAG TPA: 50S ribosomal protein L11 methyltransferase [Geothermobacteraceae bacterium]|nr:50S ribosomal protein L11 methyltransferase [Geothermobacteraceae bacterium]